MKELKATIKVFDEESDIYEVRKYIRKPILCIEGDTIDLENMSVEILDSISIYGDTISFNTTEEDEYDKFAIIEIDNQ